MNMTNFAAVAVLTGVVCGGCAKSGKEAESSTMKPTGTMTSPATQPLSAATTSTPTTSTPTASATAVPDKDMTHVLTKEEAYYTTSPAQARKPDGTLKAGTKVVVLMPRGSYSQVMTADGKRIYTSTAALKPVGS